ncbi:MAG: ATP-dependent Clp protease ATP-binding subunit ClpX, partial [Pseudomonadota bacterium]
LDTMFELPGRDDVSEVVVNEEAVSPKGKPLLVHSERKEKKPATAG